MEFKFGVTFYPDQWPQDYWEQAFSEISKAGFNVVRFGEMAWNWMEPQEDNFNFEELDKALDLAHKYKIKVILGIPTSQAPQWLIKKYPEVRPVAEDDTKYPEYGPRPNICRDVSIIKERAEILTDKIVKRYKHHPALLYWQFDNEPVYAPLDSTTNKDFCHCQDSRKEFIDWALNKYKDLKTLNQSWGTKFWTVEFGKWDEITPPRCGVWDAGNPTLFLDWLRFKSQRLGQWLKWGKQVILKSDKAHKIGTNGFIGIVSRVPDHDVLAEKMDWYGWDIYPKGGKNSVLDIARLADWWRSLAWGRGAEFQVTELQGGPNVRWGYPGYVTGEEIRLWTHQVIAHGASALLYHNWRTPLFGSETGGFGILNLDGTPSERLAAIVKTGKEVKNILDKLNGYTLKPQAAIVYLRSSDIQTYQEQGPPRAIAGQWEQIKTEIGVEHTLISLKGAHKIIWNKFNPCAFLFERNLSGGDPPKTDPLQKYQLILLPNPYLLTKKQVENLRVFVSNGGTLITEARFGLKNEFGHLYEHPLLEELLGVKYDHTSPIDDYLEIPKIGGRAYGFMDYFVGGPQKPTLIEKKIGKGKVVYANFSLFLSLTKKGNEKLLKFIQARLPKPAVKVSCSEEAEFVVWEKNKSKLLYVINHSGKMQTAKIGSQTLKLKPREILLSPIL